MAGDRVLVDMVVGASPDVVWSTLRDPALVARWFGWDYDGLQVEIRQIFAEGAMADDDARVLSWADGDTWRLEPDGTGTRVQVLRAGHHAADGFDGAYDPIDEGWITFAQQLRFALERHPGQERRTVSAHGLDLGPHDAPLLTRLGLRPLGEDPVGGPYEVRRADGSAFTGEVFFQTDLQIGLTVAEEDDALLVVARTPPSAAPPDGQVMLVLSVYGADDERLADVERRWSAWWAGSEDADADAPRA